jgi:tight adherence protein B
VRRLLSPISLVVALAAAAALAGTGAAATSEGKVVITPAGPVSYPGRAYRLTLPTKASISSSDVTVLENGQAVDSLFVGLPGSGGGTAGTALLIDASNSMRGAPIVAALDAARTFAAHRNPGQLLAIIAFNSKATTVLPFTNSGAQIKAALANPPKLAEKTHIFDALAQALTLMRNNQIAAGNIVLLSDGRDIGSTETQTAIQTALAKSHVRVFSVGLRSPQYDPKTLSGVATATGGSYAEASSAQALKPIFGRLGSLLANEYLITYRSLIPADKPVKVTVQVNGFPGTASASYKTPALASVGATFHQSFWHKELNSSAVAVLVAFIVVALVVFALWQFIRGPDIALRRRMSQFVHVATEEEARERRAEITALLAQRAERSFGNKRWWQDFVEHVQIAGIGLSPVSLVLWSLVGGLALGVVIAAISGLTWLIIVGIPIGLLAMRAYVNRALHKKRNAFAEQLPDNLDVLASALRAGHSLVGALSVVVIDADEPSKSEFQRVIADEQLGVPLDQALQVTVERMANRDLEQVAIVASLQRDTGGNSAEVLEQVAANVRARMDIRRLVRTLTAQGRMARWIVALLPVFLFCVIFLINRSYLRPLWTKTVGEVAVGLAIVLILIGSYVIKRIIEIKV